MMSNYFGFPIASVGIAILTSLALTACAAQYSAPQQIQASNPSVSYKYQTDQELIKANQNATAFCSTYQSVLGVANFSNDISGSKVVAFECVKAYQTQTQPTSNLSYNYMTDQELLVASRNAQLYCQNNGTQQVVSTMGTNVNGTKNVTFHCVP